MTDIWVSADHHFGHNNILRFTNKDGQLIRGSVFKNIEEHDTKIIEWHNELVKPEEHFYQLGDFALNKKFISYAKYMNGHKRIVLGNHDIGKTKQYLEAGFENVYSVRVWTEHNMIFSHIPLHPDCLKARKWLNVHGHMHQNQVMKDGEPDPQYKCVSLEHTNYRPLLIIR